MILRTLSNPNILNYYKAKSWQTASHFPQLFEICLLLYVLNFLEHINVKNNVKEWVVCKRKADLEAIWKTHPFS